MEIYENNNLHSRSLELTRIDQLPMSSYYSSLFTNEWQKNAM